MSHNLTLFWEELKSEWYNKMMQWEFTWSPVIKKMNARFEEAMKNESQFCPLSRNFNLPPGLERKCLLSATTLSVKLWSWWVFFCKLSYVVNRKVSVGNLWELILSSFDSTQISDKVHSDHQVKTLAFVFTTNVISRSHKANGVPHISVFAFK